MTRAYCFPPRRSFLPAFLLSLLAILPPTPVGGLCPAAQAAEASLLKSGRYHMTANGYHFDVILSVNGSAFTGKNSSGVPITKGIISGDAVSFHLNTPCCSEGQEYKGRIQGNKIIGTFTGAGCLPGQTFPWEIDLTPVTDNQPSPATLSVSISPAQQMVNSGEKLTTTAKAVGGTPPYRYEWFDGDNRSNVTGASVAWTLRNPGPRTLKVIVTDAANRKAEASCAAQLVSPEASLLKSGRYHMTAHGYHLDVILTVNGSTFTGKDSSGEQITKGIISGDAVSFHRSAACCSEGQEYKGRIQGNKIIGTFTGAGGPPGQTSPWEMDLTPVTDNQPSPATLSVSISPAQQMVNSGEKLTTTAKAVGGTPPYRYEWFDGDNRSNVTGASVNWTLRDPGPRTLRVIVTDAANKKAEASCAAQVVSPESSLLKSGRYHMTSNRDHFDVMLTVNGSAFTGKNSSGEEITKGIISGDGVSFHRATACCSEGQEYKGRIQGNKIVGTFTGAGGLPGQTYPWEIDLTPVTDNQPSSAMLSVSISPAQHTMNTGEQVTTTANVRGGAPPYQYQWFENAAPSQSKGNSVRWTMGANPGIRIIKVVVTDAAGHEAESQSNVLVQAGTPLPPNVLSGKITTGPQSSGLSGVTVIVGALGCQDGPGGNDTVFVALNHVEVLSDDSGNFTVTVPAPGTYGVLAWKEGYVWQLQTDVAVAGQISINLSRSTQVGYHTHLRRETGNEALGVSVSPAQHTMNTGEQVTTTANVRGGVPPYQYQWFENAAPSQSKGNSVLWTMGANPGIRIIKVVVTDAAGHKAEAQSNVLVQAGTPLPPNVLSGKITTGPQSSGLSGVTVIVGALDCQDGPGGNDTVFVALNHVEVLSDDSGNFTATVPAPGIYGVLAWKQGYVWDLQQRVGVPAHVSINLSPSAEVGYHTHLRRAAGVENNGPLADKLLSLNHPTKMSPNGDPAPGGNDGIKNRSFGFITPPDTHPWWQVDLGTDCKISEVRIYNSELYQPGDAKYLEIRFSSDENSWVARYQHDGSIPPYPLVIPIYNTIGRYVRIVEKEENISLHLDEVEVYGHAASGP